MSVLTQTLLKNDEVLINEELMDTIHENMRPFQTSMARYRCAMMEIETKFRVLNEVYSLEHERNPIESIHTRLKSPKGIMKKAQKKGIPQTMTAIEQEIHDIAGVRVICSFQEDIYELADFLLEQDDITLITMKDYIKHPKENGYRSLHMIVEVPIFLQSEKRLIKVEVQLRTIAMDFWASLEHKVKYKKDIPEAIEAEIVQDLKACADLSALLDKEMEQIKHKIYSAF